MELMEQCFVMDRQAQEKHILLSARWIIILIIII